MPASRYDPYLALQHKLVGLWDAERSDLITRDGSGLVSMWRGGVAGLPVTQATGAAQPVYSATSFGGFPGITFDGVDDTLETAAVAFLPSGADPGEIWLVCDQDPATVDGTSRYALGQGLGANTSARSLKPPNVAGNIRMLGVVGTGASFIQVTPNALFSGRHFIRMAVGAGSTYVEQDMQAALGTSLAGVPATATTRLRMAAFTGASATGFWKGSFALVLFTRGLLTTAEAAALSAYCQMRRRL